MNRINLKYTPVGEPYTPILPHYLRGNDDIEWIISGYIDCIYYAGNFLEAMYAILVEKDGFCEEGADCYYPELNSPFDVDRFEGVRFAFGATWESEYQVHVTEKECFEYLKIACKRFLELHPEKEYSEFLTSILDNWEPLEK